MDGGRPITKPSKRTTDRARGAATAFLERFGRAPANASFNADGSE